MHATSRTASRIRLLPLLAVLAVLGPATARAQGVPCFQGVGKAPVTQGVYKAPRAGYYIKLYPRADGSAVVNVAIGGKEVTFYVGWLLAIEADYIPASRSTVVVATVSNQRCGTAATIHVHAAQLDDGATQFTHAVDYVSAHNTGAYHREICPNGASQTITLLEGDNPVIPSNPPYRPAASGDIPDFTAPMTCPTLSWTRADGFIRSGLQGCGGCGGLDGQPCTDPCFLTPGVMRGGTCDLRAARPRCNQAAGQYCHISSTNGDIATCVTQ
jgi:hypothetical protein